MSPVEVRSERRPKVRQPTRTRGSAGQQRLQMFSASHMSPSAGGTWREILREASGKFPHVRPRWRGAVGAADGRENRAGRLVDCDELAEGLGPRVLRGIRFARSLVVLHLDPLAPRTPRLPHRRLGALTQLAASTALHVTLVVIAALIETTSAPGIDVRRAEPITDQQDRRSASRVSRARAAADGEAAGVAEAISDRSRSVARRAWARTRSPCECENGRRQQPQ